MKTVRWALPVAAAIGLVAGTARAQNVISAKSGTIHYVEGRVLLDGKQVEPKFGSFPQIHEKGVLRTEAGRAEVLLSPGVFLRIGENSEMRLISDRLTDTRLELVSGSALIECAEILKGNTITVVHNETSVSLRDDGLYRIDTDPAELRVYDGQAVVESGGQILTVKGGKAASLNGALLVRKFDTKTGDSLHRWAKRRAEYIAMANMSSAKQIHDRDLSWRRSGWYWNPYFGMFTYIPYRGAWASPFGYRYYSPREVYVVYAPLPQPAMTAWDPTPRHNANLGYATIAPTPSGSSGTVASSAPPTTSSGANSAPIPRESGSAGGRSR